MSDGYEDDRFDAFLEREAPEYHRPPAEVPRDEMWEVIARARAARPASGGGDAGHRDIQPASRRRPLRYAPWIGMAATLLIGIGLGRYALERNPSTPGAATGVVAGAAPAGSTGTSGSDSAVGGRGVSGELTPNAESTRLAASAPSIPGDAAATRRFVPVRSPRADGTQRTNSSLLASATGDANEGGYGVASRALISRAEALVAVVSTMPADATMDSLMGRWARDVLTNTRLLLDSPAGADPVRRRLLEDLETLLVQLVQRSGHPAEERELIDRTLQRTQLLTRLRSGATGT